MADKTPYKVLFLCTHNSSRSILAEAIANNHASGRFKAYSAGSTPATSPNPFALALLRENHLSVDGARSKNWDEFAVPGAPEFDFIFTVCDDAAGEVCPIWPGHPSKAHWGIPDPSIVQGSDDAKRKAFLTAFLQLRKRIDLLASLPLDTLDQLALKEQIQNIGTTLRERGE